MVFPVPLAYVPTSHFVHFVFPVPLAYVPASHFVHFVFPVPYVPGLQGVHIGSFKVPEFPYLPEKYVPGPQVFVLVTHILRELRY